LKKAGYPFVVKIASDHTWLVPLGYA